MPRRICFFVLMCAGVLAASPHGAMAETRPSLHPAFAPTVDVELADPKGNTFWLDNQAMPYRFSVETIWSNDRGKKLDPAGRLEFVLVLSGTVEFRAHLEKPVVLKVERPFYIATTELNNRQAANLIARGLGEEDSYELYSMWLQDYDVFDEHRGALTRYLGNCHLPALVDGPAMARHYLDSLAYSKRLDFRLPTIAQWHLAMRAGRATEYWWGEEWEERGVNAAQKWTDNLSDLLAALKPVKSGDPNPLGLYHVLGNVQEPVDPSREEVMVLRRHIGYGAAEPALPPPESPLLGLWARMDTTMLVGGGVSTKLPEGWFERPLSLAGILHNQHTNSWSGALAPREGIVAMVGVRPVVEIPAGAIQIRQISQGDN